MHQKNVFIFLLNCLFIGGAAAQIVEKSAIKEPVEKTSFCQKHAFYFQWGYNHEIYTPSDIHFFRTNSDPAIAYDFTVHQAAASDKPDFDAILTKPWEITVPQYNYRMGMFLDEACTSAIEINFDHTKYVVNDGQLARVTGNLRGKTVDSMLVLDPQKFLHFEHTNGANFLQINYVRQKMLLQNKAKSRSLLTAIGKVGAGIVIPKTDVTLWGKQLDNEFHIAGYTAAAEFGLRYYPFQRFFIEPTLKGGFANYTDVLIMDEGKANHSFWYLQGILLVGYEWRF
ncbi:MAG: hypothetical protein RI894_1262 [Bacteroidota bacterium]|jgi:hypothetical protein